MKRIDTHTHAWGPDTDTFPWQADVLPPGWEGPYPYEALIEDMDAIGVDEAVIVSTPLYGRGPRANAYTLRAIEVHPDRLYGVGIMDFFPDDGDVTSRLRQIIDQEGMLGVRFHAAMEYAPIPSTVNPSTTWIADKRLDPVWETLAEADAAAFIFPKADQLSVIDGLASRHPETTFVIDHMAWPDETTDPDVAPWRDFEKLAGSSNVSVKVSSLPRSSGMAWPYEDMHGYVRRLLEWFGPERLMLGSDYPWMDDWAEYAECLSWIEAMDGLSKRDRAYLSYRSFEQQFG